MSQRASPTLIGVFVLGAAALALGVVVVFGGGKIFKSTITYVAYFDGSVGGLAVGAPVEFRGVRVGSVSKIEVRVDTQDASVRIPVHLEFEQDRVTRVGGAVKPGAIIEELINERGLKAQLQLQSLVTGLLLVNLDFHPEFEAKYVGADPNFPEMPTIPTSLEQVKDAAREALAKLSSLPLEDLVRDLQYSVHGFGDLVNSPDLRNAVTNSNETLVQLQDLLRNLDGRIGPLATRLEDTLGRAETTLQVLEGKVADNSQLSLEISRALSEVAEAARAVRILADAIERQPDSLLRGKAKAGGS